MRTSDNNPAVSNALRIAKAAAAAVLSHARSQPTLEVCGLLAGIRDVADVFLPAANALNSAKAYEIAPAELFSLFRQMRDGKLELIGIVHSHPTGENFPSETDIALAYYPSTPYVIVSPRGDASRPLRAFRIQSGSVQEIEVEEV